MRKWKPYIGITDFENADQATKMAKVLTESSGVIRDRLLMVGIMMSRKTLNGLPTKWADVWPDKDELSSIFIDHYNVLNTLHYADYDGIDVLANLIRATGFGGFDLDAVQLDMIWPPVEDIMIFSDARQDLRVILQINGRSLEQAGDDPAEVVRRLEEYSGALDCVLLDKSMGRGLGMDAQALLPYLRALRDAMPDLHLAVAGGLGPDTLQLVEPIVDEFPDISIDAQGQLRKSGDSRDPIDWHRARLYIQRAMQMFGEALDRTK